MHSGYDIDEIKSGLRNCLALLQMPSMLPLAEAIRNSVDKIDEPMQLAIIGKISSSKSTLVNAILGKDELMSTGQKEMTYNVGWLKYGRPDADIIIHYKDDRPPQSRSRAEFSRLSADASHSEIDNISYIETFDDAEILKDINIIDTPGLDAKRERDSQNTLDFIAKVRPDAVVMLFTHAVAENVLDVVARFNAGASFNPLNAIGILSKIDVLWQETIPRSESALRIGRKMVGNRKKKDAMLSKVLFDLYPISALLFLASTTVTQTDIDIIKSAFEADENAFVRSLNSTATFLSGSEDVMVSAKRKGLANKIGLYGIYLIVQLLRNGKEVTLSDVKRMFMRESGALDFNKSLYNHFSNRSKLIKFESIYQHLVQKIQKIKPIVRSDSELAILANVEQRISDVFSSMVHEHQEYTLLNDFYSGRLKLDDDIAREFCNICGENGHSASDKLNMPTGTTVADLLDKAKEREWYWRKEVALEPDPGERLWMNVMLKSYSGLRQKIATMAYQYEQSKNFLFK